MANGTINKGTIVKSGGSGSGGGSTATINYFEGTTGTDLDTELSLGNSVLVFKNGVLLQPTEDYTISGSTITFVTALEATDKIAVINGNLSAIDLSAYKLKAETITYTETTKTIANVEANKNYVFSNPITSITLTACVQSFEETSINFDTASSGELSFVDNGGIIWVDGATPSLNNGKSYIIVIFNKRGFVKEY